jgi:hypothetical protein
VPHDDPFRPKADLATDTIKPSSTHWNINMAQDHSLLCAAANTEVPAYLVLRQKGYAVGCNERESERLSWHAEKGCLRFQANSVIEVLGVVCMYESRGINWAATDPEIEDFVNKHCA